LNIELLYHRETRMFSMILNYFLYFLSGILFYMSLVHLFDFEVTKTHSFVKMWQYPRLASTIWGLLFLFLCTIILLFLKYKFELNLKSLFIFLGLSFWAIFLGFISEKNKKK